jgi:hypothetical protein
MLSRQQEMPVKQGSAPARSRRVFGHPGKRTGTALRAGLYARISTHDQQTLPMQNRAMREYVARRGWTIAMQVKEVGSGASERQMRAKLIDAARRRQIDVVLVWRLDRWGRSVTDLLATLQELEHLGVGFVSLSEALDLTTPAGRAMAAMLAVFADSSAKSCASAFVLVSLMPGRTAKPWGALSPPALTLTGFTNSTAPASANPPSHANSTSDALPCVVS